MPLIFPDDAILSSFSLCPEFVIWNDFYSHPYPFLLQAIRFVCSIKSTGNAGSGLNASCFPELFLHRQLHYAFNPLVCVQSSPLTLLITPVITFHALSYIFCHSPVSMTMSRT
jgi:hypothetical protein